MTGLALLFVCLFFAGTYATKDKRTIQTGTAATPGDVTWLSYQAQQYLAHAHVDHLPESVQRLVRAIGDNSHWCCAVSTIKTTATSHAVLKYYHTSHQQKYYRGCGTWGWKKCAVHKTVYAQNAGYFTGYRVTTYKITCPNNRIVCCQGYILVAEHCLNIKDVGGVKDDLIKLKELGQLGVVG